MKPSEQCQRDAKTNQERDTDASTGDPIHSASPETCDDNDVRSHFSRTNAKATTVANFLRHCYGGYNAANRNRADCKVGSKWVFTTCCGLTVITDAAVQCERSHQRTFRCPISDDDRPVLKVLPEHAIAYAKELFPRGNILSKLMKRAVAQRTGGRIGTPMTRRDVSVLDP